MMQNLSGVGASIAKGMVLVVDDDPHVAESLARILTLKGHLVRVALDTQRAFREVEINRPQAVLLDLNMPTGNGLAFLRELRASTALSKTPVAVITGDYFASEADLAELAALGVKVHFKPVYPDDLEALVQALLEGGD
jgi:DNA-binding response OmpR family regulator